MLNKKKRVGILPVVLTLLFAVTATAKDGSKTRKSNVETTEQGSAVLWRNPEDIKARESFLRTRRGSACAPHHLYLR